MRSQCLNTSNYSSTKMSKWLKSEQAFDANCQYWTWFSIQCSGQFSAHTKKKKMYWSSLNTWPNFQCIISSAVNIALRNMPRKQLFHWLLFTYEPSSTLPLEPLSPNWKQSVSEQATPPSCQTLLCCYMLHSAGMSVFLDFSIHFDWARNAN